MTNVKPKEHYRRMNANAPTLSFRLDKEEKREIEELAQHLQTTRATLGRGILRSFIKGFREKKLEISSNGEKGTFAIKFCEPTKIETPKRRKPESKALKFFEEAYKYASNK